MTGILHPKALPPRRTALDLALICLAGAVVFMPGLWNRDLWHPMEPAYAQIAHEMVASGDWLHLTRNGEPYYNKPPFVFWLEGLAIKVFCLRTASVRLPSVLFGVATLLLTYAIARRFGTNPVIPSLVLASGWDYSVDCQRATIDVTLCFLILLAFYLYLQSTEAARGRWAYGMGAAFAVGGLTLWRRLGSRALVIAAVAALFALSITLTPYQNPAKSPKPMAQFLNSQGAAEENIVWVHSYEAGVAFYGGYTKMRRVPALDSLDAYPHSFVIATSGYVRKHQTAFGRSQPLGRFQIGNAEYLVFGTP